ncbi:hypothetical protein ACU5AX_12165 [Sphingomonas sp. XXL09]|uniref:hypothetical protein n=1 Tax=Sphingomonas sp. XXL09 TaxID=3457787 RepID=UPI00406BB7DC
MNDLFFVLAVGAIGVINAGHGRRWARLDHNPWENAPLGGLFSGPKPGLFAGDLDVDQINARGRRMMITAPIVSVVAILAYLHHHHRF